jgi:hypothetical protein
VLLGWLVAGWSAYVHEVLPALLVSCAVYLLVAWRGDPALIEWPGEDTEGRS